MSNKGETGRQLARDLSKMINSMLSEEDEQAFVEEVMKDHRTLQQKIARLFLQCIVTWAANHKYGYYDDRNKASVEIATKITNMLEEDYTVIRGKVKLPYI